jgi:hypothetical protein
MIVLYKKRSGKVKCCSVRSQGLIIFATLTAVYVEISLLHIVDYQFIACI